VFNLARTVLHTISAAPRCRPRPPRPPPRRWRATTLEFDLATGGRGELIEIGDSFRLPAIAHEAGLSLIADLGSGNLVNLRAGACRTNRRRRRASPPGPIS
jgi:hypothetical protein